MSDRTIDAQWSRTLVAVTAFVPIAALGSYLLRFRIGAIPTNALDLLLATAIVIGLAGGARVGFRNVVQKLWWYHRWIVSFGLLFLTSSTAAVFSAGPLFLDAAGQWKSVVVLPFLFLAVLLAGNDLEFLRVRTVAVAVVVGVGGVVAAALGALTFGAVTYDGRLAFPYQSPNELAMVLAPTLAGAVVLLRRFSWRILLPWVAVIAGGVALAFTQSAGAIAAFVVVVAVPTVVGIWRRHGLRAGLTALGGVTAVAAAGVFGWSSIGETLEVRREIWAVAGRLLERFWLTGMGFGTFQEWYLSFQDFFAPYREWAVPHPHNVFFSVFLGTGILGLMGFVGVVIASLVDGFRSGSPTARAAAAAIVVMLLHGLVDTTVMRNDLAVLFWTAVALTQVSYRKE